MSDNRLLVVHQGALGDFVVTFPALILLRQRFERIDVITHAAHGRLAAALNLTDDHFPAESAAFAALFASGSANPALFRRLAGYRTIVLFSISDVLEKAVRQAGAGRVVRIEPRPAAAERVHVSDYLIGRLHDHGLLAQGRNTAEHALSGRFHVLPHRAGRPAPTGALLVHPGSGSVKKMWPMDRFVNVAHGLVGRGWTVAWVLGPAERDLADAIGKAAGARMPVHMPEDLIQLLDLLCSTTGFVGNDSGVTHLAAFCGCATVAVFGPSDPRRWHPMGPAVEIVQPPGDVVPCFETDPEHCPPHAYLASIAPETVLAAVDRAMQKAQRVRGPDRKTCDGVQPDLFP